MDQNNVIECPICMDEILGEKNKVTTECGHCFHTSCLMKNVAHNGFGCPYCRNAMAEAPQDDDDEDDEFSFDEEEEDDSDYNDHVLRGARWLFQRAENQEIDDEEDTDDEDAIEEDDRPRAPIDYITEKLIQQGVTLNDFVKSILIRDHDEYQFHDEFERADDDLFGKFRIIISNFQPPAPAPAIQAVEPEPEQHQSSRLRSHESEDDDSNDSNELEVVDRNQIHYERFTKYYDSYYSSERVTRYEKMTSMVEEYSLEEKEKENNSSVRMPFNFQMKGSCVIANNGLK